MSNKKDDLTRIEDLGEFLHELSEEESNTSFETPADQVTTDQTFQDEELTFADTNTDFDKMDNSVTQEETLFSSEESFNTSEEAETSKNFTSSPPEVTSFETSDFEDRPFENSFSEPEAEPEAEFISDPIPVQSIPQSQFYKTPENFEDLKKFAENTNFSGMGVEGNPSFSVLLKNVRYVEDVNDIFTLIKELGLLVDDETQVKQRLMRGHLLIPRISEFSAIFLAHKLRRFDIDIQVGLSDEVQPPKHQELPETGIVSKYNLYQNQSHQFNFGDTKVELSQIIISATANLEGHQVVRYLGVASEHKMLEGHIVENENSEEIPRYYSELAQKLKAHAMKSHANAIIGLNYQLTPLPNEYGMGGSKYRLTCTGNLVWVNKS